MLADFDSEMRKREHEFNLRLDEMRNVVLSHELKVKSNETWITSQKRSKAVFSVSLLCLDDCKWIAYLTGAASE